MDNAKLIKAREYYEQVQGGASKKEAALSVYGKKNCQVEKSPEYLAIISAANQVQREELRSEIEQVKRKQIKSYSTLLDKGEEIMNEATTIQEKIAAQANQRENLSSGIVDSAIAWDGEDRNQADMGDVLEGVIV